MKPGGPRLPFQGNETPGRVANDLRLPAVDRELSGNSQYAPFTSPDHPAPRGPVRGVIGCGDEPFRDRLLPSPPKLVR
jgi:hypothetical protein